MKTASKPEGGTIAFIITELEPAYHDIALDLPSRATELLEKAQTKGGDSSSTLD